MNSVENAKILFGRIIKDNYSDYFFEDIPLMKFSVMNHPQGLLGSWMLQSDEISVLLTGKRLWDCIYTANGNSVDGIVPVNMENINEEIFDKHTYDQYPCAPDLIPISLIDAIAKRALDRRIVLNNSLKTIATRDVPGVYNIEAPLKHGEVLPFPSHGLIYVAELLNMESAGERNEMRKLAGLKVFNEVHQKNILH